MPSKSSARLAALTIAAVRSAASAVVLTSPAHADVHVNAEFHDQTSDHDPQVLRFHP
ncbi:hypothetical protein [Streptomyces sp. NPDC001292]|uniref:hypothetical protein n=1 Tax=Streptomyces sp. NPDC001292 TaxID=3364558 RepID=UPI0036A4D58A